MIGSAYQASRTDKPKAELKGYELLLFPKPSKYRKIDLGAWLPLVSFILGPS